jgi:hypothetical protein
MMVLLTFAAFGASFAKSPVALLWMSTVFCAVAAAMRRELPFRAELNHWDEMASYLALCSLGTSFMLAAPPA